MRRADGEEASALSDCHGQGTAIADARPSATGLGGIAGSESNGRAVPWQTWQSGVAGGSGGPPTYR